MGCWFICPLERSGGHRHWLALARDQFEKHGLSQPEEFHTPTHAVLASDAIHPHGGCVYRAPDGFAVVAGTLFYRGRFGPSALRTLHEEFTAPFTRWDDVMGQFAAAVSKGGRIHVFGDYFGTFNAFESADGRFLSTSFLSLARVLDRLTLDPQSVYEFAYNAGVLGNASLFKEVNRICPTRQLTLGGTTSEYATKKAFPAQPKAGPRDDLIDRQAAHLIRLGKTVADNFGSNVACPLSGGYDSRLLLSALRAAGVQPRVYVYGRSHSPDVQIAREIASGEGFSIEHVDKQSRPALSPEAFAAHVETDFNLVDGLSVDGSVFDDGGNAAERDRLQAGGRITSSGGGGEIYRNFFHLKDTSFRLVDVVHAFYRQFDPRTATRVFDAGTYDASVAKKMSEALDGAEGVIERRLIEQLYPAFRCRANFGREISIVGRYGAYFVPFLEPGSVQGALEFAPQAKRNGQIEAALIRKIDPGLARYRTVYGARVDSPRLTTRIDEAGTLMRPIWMRKMSFAMKARLAPQRDGHGGLLDAGHLGAVIDPEFPVMRRYFRPEAFRDDGLLRRVAIMEYMVQRLGSKVTAG